MKKKRESAARRLTIALLGLLGAFASVYLLAQLGLHLHPGVGAESAARTSLDLGARLENSLANSKAEALSGVATIRKHYVIPEDALSAPVPNPEGFGKLAISDAEKLLPVIEKARESGLLDGQELLFDVNADFYHDSFIGYYYDETILMILWKEVIGGNTCTCMEVKIADASQMRRKLAEDTLGSPVWVYASELASTVNPVVALNADFYMFRDFGIVAYQRELWRMDESTYTGQYKKYNCIETLLIDEEGDFHFTHLLESFTRSEMQQYIDENRILFSLSFGPVLVENGELKTCNWYPAGEPEVGNSRAGIAQLGKLHYYYLAVNHSPEKAALWTINDLARAFCDKGVPNAYGLDGGQTVEVLFQGTPYNYIEYNSERAVSDILYFASAIPESEVRP